MLRRYTLVASKACGMLAMALLLAGQPASAQTTYKVTELLIGPKNDVTLYSQGRAINKRGQTAIEYGYSFAGFAAAICTKAKCTMIPELHRPGISATTPSGINDAGLVTGSSFSGLVTHAFLYDGTQTIDLGGLPEDGCGGCMLDSIGRDVNNVGDVVGMAYTLSGAVRAFLYHNGSMAALATLGGDFGEAKSINDKGDIVGISTLADGSQRAFVLQNGLMSDMGTLGGTHSAAFAINEMRQVVGCATQDGDSVQRAFIYSKGSMTPLDTLGGSDDCAYGINRLGAAVGYASPPGSSETRAILWDQGQMVDLNSRLDTTTSKSWLLTEARAINDKGQIVVTGLHKGAVRAALLTPAPALSR